MNLSKKNRAVLILLATLAVGFLLGAGSVGWFSDHDEPSRKHRYLPDVSEKEHAERVEHILTKYEKMLDLNSEQKSRIRDELDRYAQAFKNLNEELRPRYEAINKERRSSFESVLNEEQLAVYRAYREERRKKSAESKDAAAESQEK